MRDLRDGENHWDRIGGKNYVGAFDRDKGRRRAASLGACRLRGRKTDFARSDRSPGRKRLKRGIAQFFLGSNCSFCRQSEARSRIVPQSDWPRYALTSRQQSRVCWPSPRQAGTLSCGAFRQSVVPCTNPARARRKCTNPARARRKLLESAGRKSD
jgi:hypothetical protein